LRKITAMHTATRYKPYREARVFSENELLFMEIQACILFTASSRPWWKRLSAGEKYRVLYAGKENSSFVKDFTTNTTLVQEV
jgi:hypothetical protein